jgi:hypothetical protein
MAESNRVQLSYLDELTFNTVPTVTASNPLREIGQFTQDALVTAANSGQSDQINSSRMIDDLIRTLQNGGGSVGFEFEYPTDGTFLSDMLSGAFYAPWTNSYNKFNNGTADSIITDVAVTTNVITVDATSAVVSSAGYIPNMSAVAVGHLLRMTGFTNAANNQRPRVTAVAAGAITCAAAGFVAEPVPPATARLKVVGFQGVSGDLVAGIGPTRLTSTALDFTTLGLSVGSFVSIGGPTAAERYNTVACNGFARISAITATQLTFDQVPVGWAADTGVAKTITVYLPDRLRNGQARRSFTVQKAWLDVLQYSRFPGFVLNDLSLEFVAEQKVSGSATFVGCPEIKNVTASLGTPVVAPILDVMTATANVARLWEAGAPLPAGMLIRTGSLKTTNNLIGITEWGSEGNADIIAGRFEPTMSLGFKFATKAMYERFLTNTPSSLWWRSFSNSPLPGLLNGGVWQMPRVKYGSGQIQTPGPNQMVMANFEATGLLDPVTNAALIFDRFSEYSA